MFHQKPTLTLSARAAQIGKLGPRAAVNMQTIINHDAHIVVLLSTDPNTFIFTLLILVAFVEHSFIAKNLLKLR